MAERKGVFISYATGDGTDFAEGLRAALIDQRIDVWQDVFKLRGGDNWWQQIVEAITSVKYVLMVLTPLALVRPTVQKEWRLARQEGVRVLPILASPDITIETLPRWMQKIQLYRLGFDPARITDAKNWTLFVNDIQTTYEPKRRPFMADDLGVYIQRSAEYDALIDLLLDTDRDEPKAITSALALKGAGGYGKTTLARAICHDERIQEAFDDGVLWVTLGESATFDTVRTQIDSLITVLSGERFDAPSLEAAKTRLRELLADRDILLVIDDVWNADHARPFLEGGDRVARLITTRMGDTLPHGTRPVAVNQMTSDEAFALITYGLPTEEAAAQRSELARLAARLGEYPLLLKLANGILHDRRHNGEPLESALGYLKRAFDKRGITKAVQVENSNDRSRAVDASLSLSLERLTPQRRERFTRLAIFPDDTAIPFVTLEKAWGCDDLDVEDGCAALNRLSLVLDYDLNARTITLHDIVRAYLREQVMESVDALKAANAAFLDAYGVIHWRDLPTDDPYLWDTLAYHLLEAGWGEDLITTVLDLRYLAAKTFHRGTQTVEADIIQAAKYARDHQHTQADALSLLERNYRNMAHILARCESVNEVLVTLHGRLSHLDALKSSCEAVEPELKTPYVTKWHELPDLPHPALIRTLTGHISWVSSAAYSPDGTRIVSAGWDGILKVWDAKNGTLLHNVVGHTTFAYSAVYSPAGARIVSASEDQTLKVRDATNGALLLNLAGHTRRVNSAAFSPDGTRIVSASYDHTLKVWDATNGALLLTLEGHPDYVTSAAYSPDGMRIVSASRDKTLKMWDAESGTLLLTLEGHMKTVTRAAYSPDGARIVSASEDKTLKVWETQNGALLLTLIGHTDEVTSAAYSPDGTCIISASNDKTLKMWDAQSGTLLLTLEGHTNGVNSAGFSPDGSCIVSAAWDGSLKVWENQRGRTASSRHNAKVTSVRFSSDGARMVSTSVDHTLNVWNVASGEARLTLEGHTNSVNSAGFSPDGMRIVSAPGEQFGNRDYGVRVWDAENGAILFTLEGHRFVVTSVEYSPDGKYILSASWDKTLKVWNADSGALVCTLSGHTLGVTSAAYSPDGRRIVSGSDDKTLKVWDAMSGALLRTLAGHISTVTRIDFHPDGTRILSASYDGKLKVWDAASGVLVHTLERHTVGMLSAAYSPDARHIVSASEDKTLKVWDADNGVSRAVFYADAPLKCCAWSPDGKYIVAGGDNGYIYWLRWVE